MGCGIGMQPPALRAWSEAGPRRGSHGRGRAAWVAFGKIMGSVTGMTNEITCRPSTSIAIGLAPQGAASASERGMGCLRPDHGAKTPRRLLPTTDDAGRGMRLQRWAQGMDGPQRAMDCG